LITTTEAPPAATQAQYGRAVKRVLWITLGLNLGVALAKLLVGLGVSSLTLIGDAAHSAIDGVNNIVGLVAVSVAARDADADHPYGHHKFETLAAFALAGFLFLTCLKIAVEAVKRLAGVQQVHPQATPLAFAVVVGTLLVNMGVARYEARRGRELKSDFLIADAAHTRSDVLVTITVLISLLLVRWGWPRVDSVLSLVVAGLIGRIGYQVFKRTVPVLVDASAVDEKQLQEIVRSVPGVVDAHAVRSRRAGDLVFIDMHLLVEPKDTERAHALTEAVEGALRSALGPTSATIHVETSRDCSSPERPLRSGRGEAG
jgi:cation diffusion facilitator family transporter